MAFTQSSTRIEWLPTAVRVFLRKRLNEAIGVGLLAVCAAVLVALIGWSPQDPSWNHDISADVQNPLGQGGAVLADLSYQYLGYAGFFFCIPLAMWGWRMLCHDPVEGILWRIASCAVAPVFVAATLALAPENWGATSAGVGGSIGGFLVASFEAALNPYIESTLLLNGVIGIIAGSAAILLLAFAMDWPVRTSPSSPASKTGKNYGEMAEKLDFTASNQSRGRRLLRSIANATIAGWKKFFDEGQKYEEFALEEFEENDIIGQNRESRESVAEKPKRASSIRRKTRISAAVQTGLEFDKKNRKDGYRAPPLDLLEATEDAARHERTRQEILQETSLLESVLADFGISGKIINIRNGPVVTLYELEPASGVKSSRVIGLADDIARSMSAVSTRIAVVPGRNAIGIELPNEHRELVALRELLGCTAFAGTGSKMKLPIILGKSITGEPIVVDLARMPHLLIAGTTGSGKSVAINALLLSLLYRLTPEQCRLIMIDPKMLELSVYDDIPHLLTPVVTDPKKAVVALKWLVREMENRYRKISKLGVRNIETYNQRIREAERKGEHLTRTVQTGVDAETGKLLYEEEELALETMPYIVVIVDEMADLMLVAGKEIEIAVQRLAQMARAAGIHMITATQRPSVDVITGTIKANFPNRVSFQMTSKIDSRTILGEQGAEQLLGRGDMLYMSGGGRIERIHGAFLSDEDVEKVARYLKQQGAPDYLLDVTEQNDEDGVDNFFAPADDNNPDQDLYNRALALIQNEKYASTSYIQRKLRIGYNRSARIIEQMQEQGIISEPNHMGRREVLTRQGDSS
ncbi:MAG: DNA translocase FtsK [Hyphomicrobiales bacterium]|nr:DNA translocase FtsK [Hyphomicrobiales bacterium]